jgi:hypothetical protein
MSEMTLCPPGTILTVNYGSLLPGGGELDEGLVVHVEPDHVEQNLLPLQHRDASILRVGQSAASGN